VGGAPREQRFGPIDVRFERLETVFVMGTLDPYPDPVTGCTLRTVFRGVQRGNSIAGRFVSENESDGKWSTGNWSAKRVVPARPATEQ
jgi:hypothetical protein